MIDMGVNGQKYGANINGQKYVANIPAYGVCISR